MDHTTEYSATARRIVIPDSSGGRDVASAAETSGVSPRAADAFAALVVVQHRLDTLIHYGLVDRTSPRLAVGPDEARQTLAALATELQSAASVLSRELPA